MIVQKNRLQNVRARELEKIARAIGEVGKRT